MINKSTPYLIIILLILLSVQQSNAQFEDNRRQAPPLRERIFYGGSFGLQLGTVTNIEASPVIGIWLLPRVAVGAGPTYQFYRDPLGKTDIYGGRTYLRFFFIQDLSQFIPLGIRLGFFAHAEYEALNLRSDFWSASSTANSRFWEHSALAGLGISQAMGMRSSVNISFLWVITESDYDLHGNPEIRIDFVF